MARKGKRRLRLTWINKERVFFTLCALLGLICAAGTFWRPGLASAVKALTGVSIDNPAPAVHPAAPVGPPLAKKELEFIRFAYTADPSEVIDGATRALFEPVTEATTLPPCDLPLPAATLAIAPTYPPVPAFLIDTPLYNPTRPGLSAHLAAERSKEKYVWTAVVSIRGKPDETVTVREYDEEAGKIVISRAGGVPMAYDVEPTGVRIKSIGLPLSKEYDRQLDLVKRDDHAGTVVLAKWCMTNDLLNEAADLLAAAIRLNPREPEPYLCLAELRLEAGSFDGALRILQEAKERGGADAEVHLRLGLLLCRLTLWEWARQEFSAAEVDEKLKGAAICYQGETYLKTGDYAAAEELFTKAARQPGAIIPARNGLGLAALLRRARGEKNEPLITGSDPLSIAAESLPEARINLAAALLLSDRPQDAARTLAEAVKGAGGDAAPLDQRLAADWIIALARTDRLGEARQQIETLRTRQPAAPAPSALLCHAPLLLAYVNILDGDADHLLPEAAEQLRTIEGAQAPGNGQELQTIHYLLAVCHLRQGRYKQAQDSFLLAAGYGFDFGSCLAGAAESAYKRRDTELAQKYLRRALVESPERSEWRRRLALLCLELGRNEAASAEANALLMADPRDAFALGSLAVVAYRELHDERAIEIVRDILQERPGDTYAVRLRDLITANRPRIRQRFEFNTADRSSVSDKWKEWREAESGGRRTASIEIKEKAVHFSVRPEGSPSEASIYKVAGGDRLLSVAADVNVEEGPEAAFGIAIAVIDTRTEKVLREVSLFMTPGLPGPQGSAAAAPGVAHSEPARVRQGQETKEVKQTLRLADRPGPGPHNLKIERGAGDAFRFFLDDKLIGEARSTLDPTRESQPSTAQGAPQQAVVVRVFGRAPAGRGWHAVVDNIDIVENRPKEGGGG